MNIKHALINFSLLFFITSHATQAQMAKPSPTMGPIEMCEKKMKILSKISACLDIEKRNKDQELETWITNQTLILKELATNTGRSSAYNMFERSQRNFVKYRENNCRWQFLAITFNTSAAIAYKKCYIRLTQYRIDEFMKINQ
mgnify:FL=1